MDLAPKQAANLTVALSTEPAPPLAGKKTMLFFRVSPAEGLEPYIGAWAHLLAVSNDLIDTIHSHPFLADGGPAMQFNLFFPRPAHLPRVDPDATQGRGQYRRPLRLP